MSAAMLTIASDPRKPGNYANSLAVYMPTGGSGARLFADVTHAASCGSLCTFSGTIAVFGLISQIVLDAGQCGKPSTRPNQCGVRVPQSGEVAMMAIITGALGVICFLSAFIKIVGRPEVDVNGNPTGKVSGIQYRFVSWMELQGLSYKLDDGGRLVPKPRAVGVDRTAPNPAPKKGKTTRHKHPRHNYVLERKVTWHSGWCLWVHAFVSTAAFFTYALTTPVGSTCFFHLPPPFSKGLPVLVALIAAIVFGFLPTPEPGIDLEHMANLAAVAAAPAAPPIQMFAAPTTPMKFGRDVEAGPTPPPRAREPALTSLPLTPRTMEEIVPLHPGEKGAL